eukprot:811340-Pleurochrysis_carterae.AAC.1
MQERQQPVMPPHPAFEALAVWPCIVEEVEFVQLGSAHCGTVLNGGGNPSARHTWPHVSALSSQQHEDLPRNQL